MAPCCSPSRPFRPASRARSSLGLVSLGFFGGLGVLATLIVPQAARAHAIESTLVRIQSLRNTLELDTHFSTGVPVEGAEVRLVSPDGRERITVGQTDRLGGLRFQLPATASAAWEVQVDGGAGHRDYLELPAAPVAAPHASRPSRPLLRGDGLLPAGLMLLGMVSGGWLWIRRSR